MPDRTRRLLWPLAERSAYGFDVPVRTVLPGVRVREGEAILPGRAGRPRLDAPLRAAFDREIERLRGTMLDELPGEFDYALEMWDTRQYVPSSVTSLVVLETSETAVLFWSPNNPSSKMHEIRRSLGLGSIEPLVREFWLLVTHEAEPAGHLAMRRRQARRRPA
jgi:hypothetical protein